MDRPIKTRCAMLVVGGGARMIRVAEVFRLQLVARYCERPGEVGEACSRKGWRIVGEGPMGRRCQRAGWKCSCQCRREREIQGDTLALHRRVPRLALGRTSILGCTGRVSCCMAKRSFSENLHEVKVRLEFSVVSAAPSPLCCSMSNAAMQGLLTV